MNSAKGSARKSSFPGKWATAPEHTCFIWSARSRRGFCKDSQQDEGPHHHCFCQVAKSSWPNVHGPDRARASIILGQKHEREIKIKGENKAAHTEEMDHASRF